MKEKFCLTITLIIEQINRAISLFDWQRSLSPLDVNKQVDLFNETILNIFRNFMPNKTFTHHSKDPPWVSQGIKTSLRKKARLYKKLRRNSSNADDLNNLNNHSRDCSYLISSSKKLYFKNLTNKLNSPHLGLKTSRFSMGILEKSKCQLFRHFLLTIALKTNFLTEVNIFNDYFSTQCSLIVNDSSLPDLYFKTDSRLNNMTSDHDSVLNIIQNLNPAKTHGWNGISIKMIEMCGQTITTPLIIIFKKAILTGILS